MCIIDIAVFRKRPTKEVLMEQILNNSFMLDVSGLLRGETRELDINAQVTIDDDLDITFIESPRIEGSAVNMSGYIELTAKLTVKYETVCARCLKPLEREMVLDLKYPIAESLENMDNDEYIIPENGLVDLSELVRENIILNLPISDICSEDCKGLCTKCGADLNLGDCGCVRVEKDPRWSVLEHFFDEE